MKKDFEKQVFRCSSCNFFPTQIELQSYFLNTDTFKCPVCRELSSFNQTQFFLLNKQRHLSKIQNCSSRSPELKQKLPIISCQINSGLSQRNLQPFQRNSEKSKRQTIWICIQKGQWIQQHLYMNPLNPELANSLNIRKAQILHENKMLFFCINDHIMRCIPSKYQLQSSSQLLPTKWKLYKYSLRKVSKIQHLMYCLDLYIQGMFQTLDQNRDNQVQIVVEIIEQKDSEQGIRRFDNSQDFSIFKFTLQQYKNLQSYYSQSSKDSSNQEIMFQNGKLQFSVKKFLQSIHNLKSSQEISQVVQERFSQQNQKISLKTFALFSNKFDFNRAKSLLQPIKEGRTINSGHSDEDNIFVHNLYLESSQLRNSKDSLNLLDSIHKTQIYDQMYLSHSFMYIPHCQQHITLNHLINKLLTDLKEYSQKRFHRQDEAKFKSEKMNFQGKKSLGGLNNVKFSQKNTQAKRKQSDQSQVQMDVFVYWKAVANRGENSEFSIQFTKFYDKSLVKSLRVLILELSDPLIHRPIDSTVELIQKQILTFLNADHGQKIQTNIKIDRIYVKSSKTTFFYVFSFEQIIRQNFEELDFVDEHFLPDELKGYSNTYKRVEQRPENPFRKQNVRVCRIKQENEDSYEFEGSDGEFQTL